MSKELWKEALDRANEIVNKVASEEDHKINVELRAYLVAGFYMMWCMHDKHGSPSIEDMEQTTELATSLAHAVLENVKKGAKA